MKKKQKLLVALMALTLAGGVGSALALSYSQAAASDNGGFDSAIVMTWSGLNAQAKLDDMNDLQRNVTQYRYLQVNLSATHSVTESVDLTFTLAKTEDSNPNYYHIEGLSVALYQTTSLFTNANSDSSAVSFLAGTPSAIDTLTKDNLTETVNINPFNSNGTTAQSHTKYYMIAVTWDGSSAPVSNENSARRTLGGSLTISLGLHQA